MTTSRIGLLSAEFEKCLSARRRIRAHGLPISRTVVFDGSELQQQLLERMRTLCRFKGCARSGRQTGTRLPGSRPADVRQHSAAKDEKRTVVPIMKILPMQRLCGAYLKAT